MPPNIKGGKQYKKKAKSAGEGTNAIMIERQPGQQIARVIKVLGNRFMSCYCNDNKLRTCHVRGKMRGRDFVEKGDIVLVSLREFEAGASTEELTKELTGDILAKYPYETISSLKKESGINPKLFMQLELLDGTRLAEIGNSIIGLTEPDSNWEFDRDDDAAVDKTEEGISRPPNPVPDDFNIDDI